MHVEAPRKDGQTTLAEKLEPYVFGYRALILGLFTVLTVGFGWLAASGLKLDTNFTKQLPLDHEYIQTYLDHKTDFGGANRLLIALMARDGDMFTPEFFAALRDATDAVLVMDGIDRGRVQSLFTPNVRYIEVVEDGIQAGNVVDASDTAGLRAPEVVIAELGRRTTTSALARPCVTSVPL